MGTRTMLWTIGAVAMIIAMWNGASTIAAVVLVGTVILVSIHGLEVKINKLLDDRGIYVTDKDLRD